MSKQAWVTLATNDSYALGALVLAHSLRRVSSAFPAVVIITPSVTDNMRGRLGVVFGEVVVVDVLDSRDAAHLALLARPELGITFTKIHCWSLTQYEKCVFLDADTLVLQNCDELFEREELSAAPDVGWPDCFNSGVFVYRPSAETFSSLLQFAQERGSFDGGDQGLLNSYFSSWAHGDITKHLPFLYNVTSAAFYSYLPALKHYGENLKIIHFIGTAKPWLQRFNWESRAVSGGEGHLLPTLQLWWDIFVQDVHPQLDDTMAGLAGTLSRLTLGAAAPQQAALDEHTRRQGWEAGNIDYLGADSFANIWAKISATLAQSPPAPAAPALAPAPESAPESPAAPEQTLEPVVPECESCVPAPVPAPAPVETSVPAPIEPESPASIATPEPAPVVPLVAVAVEHLSTASIETPVPTSAEPPVAAPIETPVTELVESPVAASVETPAAAPIEMPVAEPAEHPTAAPIELPVAATIESPLAAPVEPPAAAPVETPVGEHAGAPTAPPVVCPVSSPVEPPAAATVEPPVAETIISPVTATVQSPAATTVETSLASAETLEPPMSASAAEESATAPTQPRTPSTQPPPVDTPPFEPPTDRVEAPTSALAPAEASSAQPTTIPIEKVPESSAADPTPSSGVATEVTEVPQVATVIAEVLAAAPQPQTPVASPEATPAPAAMTPPAASPVSPPLLLSSSDSPPLVSTPVKDTESPKSAEEAKSDTRIRDTIEGDEKADSRKAPPKDKLFCQLKPSAEPAPLLTPDSELEDAATLAQSIIASELTPATPSVTSATPPALATPTPLALNQKRLSVEEPVLDTPPVSLAQIGIVTTTPGTISTETKTSQKIDAQKVSIIPEGVAATEASEKKTVKTKSGSSPNTPPTSAPATPENVKPPTRTSTAKEAAEPAKVAEPTNLAVTKKETESAKVPEPSKMVKPAELPKTPEIPPVIESTKVTEPAKSVKPVKLGSKVAPLSEKKVETKFSEKEEPATPPVIEKKSEKPEISSKSATKSAPAEVKGKVQQKEDPTVESKTEDAPAEPPKKKIVKKVVKKESAESGGKSEASGGDTAAAPVPPPRKKVQKPKEK